MGIEKISHFWPDWELKEILGEGAYGKVYRAEKNDPMLHSEAAIKVVSVPQSQAELAGLRAEGMDDTASKTYLHGIVEDFVNEVKLMENLKGVTNIVSVEDFKVTPRDSGIGWDIFIRMELLTPFSSCVERGMSESDIIKLGVDICTALEICSRMNIIHRDIKPANIFISKMGDYKLGDFGIAKKLEATSSAMSAKGTQSYVAPEVLRGGKYDSTVDIYSLGLVMYRLLNNNRPPFIAPESQMMSYRERQDANDKRLSGEALPPPCNASDELANIILTACSFDPSRRFKTASEFKNALLSYVSGKKPTITRTPPKPEPNNEETRKAKKGLVIALVILLILTVGATAVIFGKKLLDKESNIKEKSDTASVTDIKDTTDTDSSAPVPDPAPEIFTEEMADGIWYADITADQFEKLTGSSISRNLSAFTGVDAEVDIDSYPHMLFIFEFFDEEKKSICYYSQDSLEAYLTKYVEDTTEYFHDPEVLAHIRGITLDELYITMELEGLTLEETADLFISEYITGFDIQSSARNLANEFKQNVCSYEIHESGLTVFADTKLEMSYEDGTLCCTKNGVEMALTKDIEALYERSVLTTPEYDLIKGYWYAPITPESVLTLNGMDPNDFITFSVEDLGLGSYSWPEAEIYCDGDSRTEVRINGYDLKVANFTYLAAYFDRMSMTEIYANKVGTTTEKLDEEARANGKENWKIYIQEIAAGFRMTLATLEKTNCPDIVYDDYFYRTTNSDIMYMTDSEYTESFRYNMGDLTLIYSNASSRLSELCGENTTFEFYSKNTPKY